MATAAKKTAESTRARAVRPPTDRPRRAKPPVEDIPMPELEVLDFRTEDMDTEPDMVEVFRLDGKPYFVDRNVGAGVALRMLGSLRRQGQEAAVATMLMELLGEKAFDDLSHFRGIRPKHFAQVLMQCTRVILGNEEEGPKV